MNRTANCNLYSTLKAIAQWGLVSVSRLLQRGAHVNVIFEDLHVWHSHMIGKLSPPVFTTSVLDSITTGIGFNTRTLPHARRMVKPIASQLRHRGGICFIKLMIKRCTKQVFMCRTPTSIFMIYKTIYYSTGACALDWNIPCCFRPARDIHILWKHQVQLYRMLVASILKLSGKQSMIQWMTKLHNIKLDL